MKRGYILFIFGTIAAQITHSIEELRNAVNEGDPEMVQRILDAGVTILDALEQGYLPLHHAVETGYDAIVELFIKNGSLVNTRTYFGRTPLHEAALQNDYRLVKLLLARGAFPGALDAQGKTPAQLAYNKAVKDLLTGAVSYKDNRDTYVLSKQLKKKSPKQLKAILYMASLLGDAEVLRALSSTSLDLTMPLDTRGNTALHITATYDHLDATKVLLPLVKPNLHNKIQETPLIRAVRTGDQELIALLLTKVPPTEKEWDRLISEALDKGNNPLAQWLLMKRANV